MKTLVSKMVIPLLVLLGTFLTSPVYAKAYKVTNLVIYKTSAGDTEGYVQTGANGSQCCVFFLRGNGFSNGGDAPAILALSTALQMNQAVVYFYGTSGSGPYGDFEDNDNAEDVSLVELWKDPATLPANVQHATPFEIYAGGQYLEWYATCKQGSCRSGSYPGYSGGWQKTYMLAHAQWFNYLGDGTGRHIGALGAVFDAFSSGQYGVSVELPSGGVSNISFYSPYFTP